MSPTFKDYLESKGHSTNTINRFYTDVLMFMNWCEEEEIESESSTYNEVLSYIHHLSKRGLKQRTVQLYINSIKHYFAWCIQQELRTENPTTQIKIKGIKRKTLHHILSKQDLESLYHQYEITEEENTNELSVLTSKRNKMIIGLLVYQGLSTQELGKLEEKDVKLREGKIEIRGSRKSNPRTLKLEAHQVLDIMEYTLQVRPKLLAINKTKSDKLLVNSQGGSHFSNVMQYLMKQLKKQNSGVKSAQQIRTSVITHWLKRYNLREVQYRAGHRYVSSTEAYLINDLEGLKEDIEKFHPFLETTAAVKKQTNGR